MDSHIKRIVNSVIDTGKRKHGFNKKSEDDKIEYFLKYSLLEIVPSKKWVEYTDDKEDAGNDLYIVLKRHYFLNTNSFPQ
ncbi:MAG: hypothetical protein FH753_11080 [Firmicutes bacterium]|nr:hypothetical protein [Bacillota bacterium]